MPPSISEQDLSAPAIELSSTGIEHVDAQPRQRRVAPWLGLACILVAYVIAVIRLHPTNFFGHVDDDAIYFSSAKALAEGRGYILPSVPGTPAATKYPVLYPWMLSWIWRLNPSFPENLSDAIAVNVVFGLLFITLVFVFLRRVERFSQTEILVITAVCAFHPIVTFYSGNLTTEIPFSALMLGAVIVADKAMRPDSPTHYALVCGALAGLSMDLRMFGLAVVAGISVTALVRRAWRQMSCFALSSGVFVLPTVWNGIVYRQTPSNVAANRAVSFGWDRAWAYYTSYPAIYRAGIPAWHVFWAMLRNNAGTLLRTPSDYLLFPSLARPTLAGLAGSVVLTGVILAGIFRSAREKGWKPIHFVLTLYGVTALLWSFNDFYRFFIPFLPLFTAAYWTETKHLLGMVREAVTRRRSREDMVFASLFAIVIGATNLAIAWNYFGGAQKMVSVISEKRGAILPAKRQAYEWISRTTDSDSRFIAYEDADIYLYTGRQAMHPIQFTVAEFLDLGRLRVVLQHMTDVAQAISANYWVVSDDDFDREWAAASEGGVRRTLEVVSDLQPVFRSTDGRVRVYSLASMRTSEQAHGLSDRNSGHHE